MTADLYGTQKRASLRALCSRGSLEGPGEEKAPAGLGETTPTGFGIHSKFSALVANARLLTKGVSEEESLQGTPRALWVLCIDPCSPPVPPQTQPTWRVPETPPSAGQLCQ